jgi:hypothetical protein
MILTGENRINGRKPSLSATLSTTNVTWTDKHDLEYTGEIQMKTLKVQ